MDEGSPSTPVIVRYFDVSDDGFAWRDPRPEQIRERRAAMDDKLIFDILLISGGVRDPDFIYPPHDVQGLNRLLDAIDSSHYDTLKKQTLYYFLLKWHQDGREDKFKAKFCIPPQFSALADAYWHLDSGINIGKAISILSDSRLNRDYASKIIQAITLAPEPGPLLRRYVRTASPSLVEPPDLLRYVIALAESSFIEAWHFQRTFAETDGLRPRLFKKLLDWTVSPKPQPKALKDLISLPLSKYEEGLLNDHALKPPEDFSTADVARLQDLICVRYIELGKYADAIKMDRKFSSTAYDGRESSERRSMIRELYEALPPVEKSLIDMPVQVEKPKPAQPPSNNEAALSQSWEEVRVPDGLNKSTSTPLRNIQIPTSSTPSGPRFTVQTATVAEAPAANTPAPILSLPTMTTTPAKLVFTPRKSLSNSLNSSLLGSAKNRAPLSGVGQRLAAGASPGVSSPASGIRFPLHSKPPSQVSHAVAGSSAVPSSAPPVVPPAPAAPVFKSTTNQANAFYQPKANQKQKRVFEEVEQSPECSVVGREVEEETMGVDDESRHGEEDADALREAEEEEEVPGWRGAEIADTTLNQSIFAPQPASQSISKPRERERVSASQASGKKPAASTKAQERAPPKGKAPKKQPPGAFAADDDDDEAHETQSDEGGQEEGQEEEEAIVRPSTRRRAIQARQAATSASARVKTDEPNGTSRGRTSRGRTSRISKGDAPDSTRIPGNFLTEHELHQHTDAEEEEQEEEGDRVAPLRQPSPATATATASRRPIRKTRSLASNSDFGGDEEGMTTRRRSSRLTATSSVRNLSPESVTAPKPAVKKSRTSATKKRK